MQPIASNIPVSTSWIDITDSVAGLSNVTAWIQNDGGNVLVVAYSSDSTPPDSASLEGKTVPPMATVGAIGAHIWVRTVVGGSSITVGLGHVSLAAAGTNSTALPYVDKSVPSLSATQAAGTDLVLAANPRRRAISIIPTVDSRLYYTGNKTVDGPYFPMYGGVAFQRSGLECPAGDLYVTAGDGTALVTGSKLRIAEA